MSTFTPIEFSPFAQLIDPKAFSLAVAHSERLARLKRRVCRPLDKPLIPLARSAAQVQCDLELERSVMVASSDAH
jgi:hypothetical protein